MEKIAGKWVISKIDFASGFMQLPIADPASRAATSFQWGQEVWHFTRLPFGLKNGPAAYASVMDYELKNMGWMDSRRVALTMC